MKKKGILIAEGDSWFRFGPLGFDILDGLKDLGYEVCSVADHGDLLEEMVDQFSDEDGLEKKLEEIAYSGKEPSAILLSGGGNDFTGKEKKDKEKDKYRLEQLLNFAGSQPVLNEEKVAEVIDAKLYVLYQKLIGKINATCGEQFSNRIPVLIHGYSYVVPDGRWIGSDAISNAGMRGRLGEGDLGPWIKPAFDNKNYNNKGYESKSQIHLQSLQKNTAVMEALIDRFNKMIKEGLVKLPFDHVKIKHVDLRRCMSNSLKGMPKFGNYRKDWQDELHPTVQAFEKIAKEFDAAIEEL